MSQTILYQGLLRSPASWARVGRGLIEGSIALGHGVRAVHTRGFRYDASFCLPADIIELEASRIDTVLPAIGIGFLQPPLVHRLRGEPRLNLCVWESDRIPPAWIEAFREHHDVAIVVPSVFTRDAFIAGGIAAHRIVHVPFGYSPALVESATALAQERQAGARDGPFTILTIAAPHWRKGIAEMLRAYSRTFSKRDEVRFVIKTTYDPGANARRFPFEIPSWACLFDDVGLCRADAPPVDLRIETARDDRDCARYYAEADLYAGASWGESFGLAQLEALACGVSVIATGWGGVVDFVPNDDDRVGFERQERPEAVYAEGVAGGIAVPHVDAIAQRMRWHYEHREASREGAIELARRVASMTWRASSERLLGFAKNWQNC